MKPHARIIVLLVLLLVAGTACDPGQRVVFYNATDGLVEVSFIGNTSVSEKASVGRLQPGETSRSYTFGFGGSSYRRKVEAVDAAGILIFCRWYSDDDIKRIGGKIEITKDHFGCS